MSTAQADLRRVAGKECQGFSQSAWVMKVTADIVIYETGEARVALRLERESVWLSLQQLAELFGRDKSVISRHLRSIFASGELERQATVAKNATVQREGGRDVVRDIEYYKLDTIISVGYRVNSARATRFRQWANKVLREHLTRGFSLDRQRFEQNAAELDAALPLVKKAAAGEALSADMGRGLVAESDAKNKEVMIRLIENMLALPAVPEGG